MKFTWNRPSYYAGHLYEMEGYVNHYPDNKEPVTGEYLNEWKGNIQEYELVASDLMAKMEVGDKMVFREHALNRCRVMGPFGKYEIYEKRECKVDRNPGAGTPCHELAWVESWDHPTYKANKNLAVDVDVSSTVTTIETGSSTSVTVESKEIEIDLGDLEDESDEEVTETTAEIVADKIAEVKEAVSVEVVAGGDA